MVKRFFSLDASEIENLNSRELLESIKSSEGRIVLSECIVAFQPPIYGLTNAEVAKAFGADLILLNIFDVDRPFIFNLGEGKDVVKRLKELVSRPIGVNLEPVDNSANMMEERLEISSGRTATRENLAKLDEYGFDFVCFTGNPSTGVSNNAILDAIRIAKSEFSGLIIAGKMHASGVDEPIVDIKSIEQFIEAGADIILVPSVGTVPGVTDEDIREVVRLAHKKDTLVMATIGTSQESASRETIREIALRNKINGVDIHHIGDAGIGGVALAENIYELGVTIRGTRHTIHQMAASIKR
ncbi:MAG: haloacid dehalogenase-like hydrolase [Ezakiella sp.]|nr:haloacid dehalogenase-like hydrolase [Bacillota bacterium]MDY3947628.1 haloacid dehalogenase-like hydrolase [Ezakiella sp.]